MIQSAGVVLQSSTTGWKSCPPYFFEGRLPNSSKFDEKGQMGGVIVPSQKSVLASLHLAFNDKILVLRSLEYSPIYV